MARKEGQKRNIFRWNKRSRTKWTCWSSFRYKVDSRYGTQCVCILPCLWERVIFVALLRRWVWHTHTHWITSINKMAERTGKWAPKIRSPFLPSPSFSFFIIFIIYLSSSLFARCTWELRRVAVRDYQYWLGQQGIFGRERNYRTTENHRLSGSLKSHISSKKGQTLLWHPSEDGSRTR